jgi:hypothetical protein
VQRELQSLLIARGFSSFKDAIGYAHRSETGGAV